MLRRLAGTFLLSSCLGCGSMAAPEAAPPSLTFDLLAWEYPGARPIARIDPALMASDKVGREEIAREPREGTRIKAPALYAFDTPDSLESVYAFFGRKLDLDPEYKPAALDFAEQNWNSSSKFGYENRGAYPSLRMSYTGLEGRQDVVKSATLVGPGGPGFSVVIVLSRARSEGYTTIELIVTRGW